MRAGPLAVTAHLRDALGGNEVLPRDEVHIQMSAPGFNAEGRRPKLILEEDAACVVETNEHLGKRIAAARFAWRMIVENRQTLMAGRTVFDADLDWRGWAPIAWYDCHTIVGRLADGTICERSVSPARDGCFGMSNEWRKAYETRDAHIERDFQFELWGRLNALRPEWSMFNRYATLEEAESAVKIPRIKGINFHVRDRNGSFLSIGKRSPPTAVDPMTLTDELIKRASRMGH